MKRPLLHRLFSIWLALLVLTTSVGLAVQQHTCRQSGQRTAAVIFRPTQHGCPAPKASAAHHTHQARLTSSCCEFGAHFHKLDVPSAELAWVKIPAPALAPTWPTLPSGPVAPGPRYQQQTARWHASDTSPPPRGGRVLLTFVGVLVV